VVLASGLRIAFEQSHCVLLFTLPWFVPTLMSFLGASLSIDDLCCADMNQQRVVDGFWLGALAILAPVCLVRVAIYLSLG
jgi:hypothetical protein